MKKLPDLIFIIDTNIESLAVNEAKRLNIPIMQYLILTLILLILIFLFPGMTMQEGQ